MVVLLPDARTERMNGVAAAQRPASSAPGQEPEWVTEQITARRMPPPAAHVAGNDQSPPAPDAPPAPAQATVADEVVAQIAAIAARQIAGVSDLVVPRSRDPLVRFLQRFGGVGTHSVPGVRVHMGRDDVRVALTLAVHYGAGIPLVVEAVRTSVAEQVQTLTGLAVRRVAVDVRQLHFPPPTPPHNAAAEDDRAAQFHTQAGPYP